MAQIHGQFRGTYAVLRTDRAHVLQALYAVGLQEITGQAAAKGGTWSAVNLLTKVNTRPLQDTEDRGEAANNDPALPPEFLLFYRRRWRQKMSRFQRLRTVQEIKIPKPAWASEIRKRKYPAKAKDKPAAKSAKAGHPNAPRQPLYRRLARALTRGGLGTYDREFYRMQNGRVGMSWIKMKYQEEPSPP